MNTTHKSAGEMKTDLATAAAKSGISLDGTTITWATLENTWGDACGWVFTGPQAERAATFAKAWALKHLSPQRSYNAQYSVHAVEACKVAKDSCGNIFTHPDRINGGEGLVWVDGFRLQVVYYPCAD